MNEASSNDRVSGFYLQIQMIYGRNKEKDQRSKRVHNNLDVPLNV